MLILYITASSWKFLLGCTEIIITEAKATLLLVAAALQIILNTSQKGSEKYAFLWHISKPFRVWFKKGEESFMWYKMHQEWQLCHIWCFAYGPLLCRAGHKMCFRAFSGSLLQISQWIKRAHLAIQTCLNSFPYYLLALFLSRVQHKLLPSATIGGRRILSVMLS